MSHWGGAAGGWSNTGHPGMQRPSNLKRSVDGWDDEELGKLYDHSVMRRLFPYLRPYKRQAGLALAGMMISTVTSLTPYYLVKVVTDKMIPSGDLRGVGFIGLALIGLALVSWLG